MNATIQDDIAEALFDFISEVSERCWCAGWQDSCDRDLYKIVFKGDSARWGFGEVTAEQVAKLKRMAEASDSWWYWPTDESNPRRITLAEADRLFGNEKSHA